MNAEHIGMFVTFIITGILLTTVFLLQSNINILPETVPHDSSFVEYCKQLNLKC